MNDFLLYGGIILGVIGGLFLLLFVFLNIQQRVRERGKFYKMLKKRIETLENGKGKKNLVAIECNIIEDLMYSVEEENEATAICNILTILVFWGFLFGGVFFFPTKEGETIVLNDAPLGWRIAMVIIVLLLFVMGYAYCNRLKERKYSAYTIQWRIANLNDKELREMADIEIKVNKRGTINEKWIAYYISKNKRFFEIDFDVYSKENQEELHKMVRRYYGDEYQKGWRFTYE